LPTPTCAETAEIARRTAERIERILQAYGRSLDPELADPRPTEFELDQPGLAACYEAAARGIETSGKRAGQPSLRLIAGDAEQVAPTDVPGGGA
jgi:hypothetical protein